MTKVLQKKLLWKKFVDDIFILSKGFRRLCDQMVDGLNNIKPGLLGLEANDTGGKTCDKSLHRTYKPSAVSGL